MPYGRPPTNQPQGGEPLDTNYSLDGFAPEALLRAIKDCAEFEENNAADIRDGATGHNPNSAIVAQAGHDFWLTRNGHGAGFWDGDWSEPQASRLTEASDAFGEVNLYVGDNGRLYFS